MFVVLIDFEFFALLFVHMNAGCPMCILWKLVVLVFFYC